MASRIDREVHDGGHAREVLEDDARGHERDLGLGRLTRVARRRGVSTSSSRTMPPPACRSTFSSRIFTVTGGAARSIRPARASSR